MLKEISKKISMKKSFFTTQLDNFFSTITQEYNEYIREIELEKKALEERIKELEKDVKNLVEIKKGYEEKLKENKQIIDIKDLNSIEYTKKLQKENEILKEEIERLKTNNTKKSDPKEIEDLKQKVKKLQLSLAKGISAYNDNIQNQKSEELIKEITKSLKK